jgi:CheY-like chemotaxis protein
LVARPVLLVEASNGGVEREPREAYTMIIMASSPITIAVIDNDADLLLLIGEILRGRGWKIAPCLTSVTALELLRAEPPDAILLDLWLDVGITGWTLLGELRADAVLGSIPVIICSSALEQLRDKEEWLGEQGVGILPKPFDLDDLYETVEEALEGRVKVHKLF